MLEIHDSDHHVLALQRRDGVTRLYPMPQAMLLPPNTFLRPMYFQTNFPSRLLINCDRIPTLLSILR
jgi:hypothetical protein